MEQKEITLYGMLDNVKHQQQQEPYWERVLSAALVDVRGDESLPTMPDSLSFSMAWDARLTDQGEESMDSHVNGMEPADAPAWMRNGSYVAMRCLANGDGIVVRAITYQEANGLSHTAIAKQQ